MSVWTGFSRLMMGISDGEHGNKPSGSTEGEEILHQPSDCKGEMRISWEQNEMKIMLNGDLNLVAVEFSGGLGTVAQ